ncbi:(deoxy)nucleoside triphosphate pyrophosphohydrolase [Actinomyces sp.]|uniref:(deoxy)nucleoside triphosphate pyrophosphohydrolase n=1 Tax=Actinomyces sp. TaxID=29317 RepID=UPI0026DCF661|nr:NUDIX domain-containing protein [Actinomyces sp.]MDO4900158.1 NUDIX domain-containing protein [Actinomyces sp.]
MLETRRARPSRLVVAAAVLDRLPNADQTDAGRAPTASSAATAAPCPTRAAPSRLLCAARAYPAEHTGQYEFPGGKVEPGETPKAALVRELAEELSMGVRLGAEILPSPDLAVPPPTAGPDSDTDTAALPGDDRPAWPAMHGYRMRVWLAEPMGTARLGGAHATLSWVPLDEVGTLPWLPADRPILEALNRMLAHAR